MTTNPTPNTSPTPDGPLVTLRCPRCKAEKRAPCDDFDPYGTETVVIICPDCDDGDRHAPEFFDKDGKWIDPAEGFA